MEGLTSFSILLSHFFENVALSFRGAYVYDGTYAILGEEKSERKDGK